MLKIYNTSQNIIWIFTEYDDDNYDEHTCTQTFK
jgi:hypothetical protein